MLVKKLVTLSLILALVLLVGHLAFAGSQLGTLKEMDLDKKTFSITTPEGGEQRFQLSEEAYKSLENFKVGEEIKVFYEGDMATDIKAPE